MKGESVASFDQFLKRSKKGRGHTYQLHRRLGGAFIDAAFYNEDNQLVTYRITLPQPTSVNQELRWDEHHFPYEFERYQIGSKSVEVKLYRALTPRSAFFYFLEDVVSEFDEETAPEEIVRSLAIVRESVNKIVEAIEKIDEEIDLTKQEKHAIDMFFGNSDIWRSRQHFEEDLAMAFAEYLQRAIEEKVDLYHKKEKEAQIERTQRFSEINEQLINGYLSRLKQHDFKEGYVSK